MALGHNEGHRYATIHVCLYSKIVGGRYRPNYWTYSFEWVPNHRDHDESNHMKNSCFSGAGFFTGAEIKPGTFMVRVRRATAEPPWLLDFFSRSS